MIDAEKLLSVARSENQRRIISAVQETGSFRAAARKLGLEKDAPRRVIKRLERRLEQVEHADEILDFDVDAIRMAARGWAPDHELTQPAPPGFLYKRLSTYRNLETGEATRRWEIANADEKLRYEAVVAAIRAEAQNVVRMPLVAAPQRTLKHLLNFYVFTDYHLGMRAWSEQGGADWNLEIAERLIIQAFQFMMATAPQARVGFIGQLGDFMHFDGLRPVTPTSGHIVDAAAHYQQIVRACIRILKTMVNLALQRHEEVWLLAAEGNHDLGSSAWMRELAAVLFENEPRVKIINNGMPYYAVQWGKQMIGVHHGHGTKKENLPLKFASFFPEIWGATQFREAHAGHLHHEVEIRDHDGMTIHQWPTLAPNDNHSSLGGYHSKRETSVISYDERFGKIGTIPVTPQMLAAYYDEAA